MANEISTTATLTCAKTGTTVTGSQTKLITLAGIGQWATNMLVGVTSGEKILYPPDLTTEGLTYVWLKNADTVNYIEIALDSGMTNKFGKLLAGEHMLLRVHDVSPGHYVQSNSTECTLQIVAVGT